MALTHAHHALATNKLDWSSAARWAAELGVHQFVNCQYYELRLASSDAQVDYLMSFPRERAAELRDAITAAIVRDRAYRAPGWLAIRSLLEHWGDVESPLSRRTPMIWFELDEHERQPRGAVPSVSVCISPGYDAARPHTPNSPTDWWHARATLGWLRVESEASRHLQRVFTDLPPRARWIHLSYMLGRRPCAIKLYGVMRRADLLPYLARIGWSGERSAIERALPELYPENLLGDDLYLDLNLDDFRDARRATLGLAVAQQHLLSGDHDPCRRGILERWMAAGLCDAAKVSRVLAWPAPAGALVPAAFRGSRYLDVKLVWRPAQGFIAKGYAGFERPRGVF